MGAFMFAAMTLVALTLLALLRPWQDRRPDHEATAREINAGIYRDQLAELDRDLASGVISAADHGVARDELQRRLLEDAAASELPAAQAARSRQTLLAIAIGLPLAASGLYAMLGEPGALLPRPAPTVAAGQGVTQQDIERMVASLAARLEKNPDDPKGWSMLGRSYRVMGRFDEAAAAFKRVGPDLHRDPTLLAVYADTLAAAANGNLEGEPMKLVDEALRLDPNHPMALSLAATDAYKRRDFPTAARYWQTLLKQLPPDSEDARSVMNVLAEIGAPVTGAGPRAEAGAPMAAAPTAAAPVRAAGPATPASPDGAAVAGIVSLAPALQANVKPDDTVFVFARPTDGSRMPLAVQRARVADLPLRFRLDDSMAMSPQAKISAAKEVRIEALVSRSGTANASSGDLMGASAPVAPGNLQVALTIDRVRP
jgi:cytochrome c-type biogenesis protein CcmH